MKSVLTHAAAAIVGGFVLTFWVVLGLASDDEFCAYVMKYFKHLL